MQSQKEEGQKVRKGARQKGKAQKLHAEMSVMQREVSFSSLLGCRDGAISGGLHLGPDAQPEHEDFVAK